MHRNVGIFLMKFDGQKTKGYLKLVEKNVILNYTQKRLKSEKKMSWG